MGEDGSSRVAVQSLLSVDEGGRGQSGSPVGALRGAKVGETVTVQLVL